ncbi:hypothetical protein V6N13_120792 [Hibiscus sabdariffa]|uniref:Uncharacterized protein n=1 Tax=Hibiscus sabdariffa TaxID=183260 RepID=A0ABR2E5B0_9ROSI
MDDQDSVTATYLLSSHKSYQISSLTRSIESHRKATQDCKDQRAGRFWGIVFGHELPFYLNAIKVINNLLTVFKGK